MPDNVTTERPSAPAPEDRDRCPECGARLSDWEGPLCTTCNDIDLGLHGRRGIC